MTDTFIANPGAGGLTFASDDIAGVQYPISKIAHGALDSATLVSITSGLPVGVRDSNSVGITSISDGAGQVGLTTAIGATNFVLSTANSTVAQLGAAATFTGVIETIYNQQAISVLLTSDQNGTLTLKQYIDLAGTRLISSWAFPIVAGVPFSRCFVGNGNYFNLTFLNSGGSTTTTLNINTAYGTLPSATNLGYMPISINEVNGTAISLGQGTMAASIPVVLPSNQSAIPVTVSSGTVTTVSTVTAVTTLSNGQTAHSAASTGSPVRVAGRVNTAQDTTLVAGDASDLFITTSGALVEKPFSVPELDWQATSGITPLATTTSTALKAAAAAGVRNYCTAVQLYNTSATISTTASILDGSTVIWTGFLPATTAALPIVDLQVTFPTPLRGTAATAMNIQLGTTAASVYYNAQGYTAP